VRGILDKLAITARVEGDNLVADYTLVVGGTPLPLNGLIGRGLQLCAIGVYSCSACGASTKKPYGGSYCYECFTTLARCDLCVMSPSRCHYAEGTCREPAWGESFCMQPHSVYLANSSGPKVGITRQGREHQRWMDQGASQALVIADASTRKSAGDLEIVLAQMVSDRTDWKRLVNGAPTSLNLPQLVPQLHARADEMPGVSWKQSLTPISISYPIEMYSPPKRIKLDQQQSEICDNLMGIKGQFLLLTQGAFNVAEHQGLEVEVQFKEPLAAEDIAGSDQLTLF